METLSNYIKAGKQINEFLVKGKFKKTNNIYWPTFKSLGDDKYEFIEWEELKVKGNGKYVIYDDMYYGDKYHIADVGDMISRYGFYLDDFEDFDEKNIYGRYETLKEAVVNLCALNGLTINQIKQIEKSKSFDDDDIQKLLDIGTMNCADNAIFIWEVLTGKISDDDYDNTVGDGNPKKINDYFKYFEESLEYSSIEITNIKDMIEDE